MRYARLVFAVFMVLFFAQDVRLEAKSARAYNLGLAGEARSIFTKQTISLRDTELGTTYRAPVTEIGILLPGNGCNIRYAVAIQSAHKDSMPVTQPLVLGGENVGAGDDKKPVNLEYRVDANPSHRFEISWPVSRMGFGPALLIEHDRIELSGSAKVNDKQVSASETFGQTFLGVGVAFRQMGPFTSMQVIAAFSDRMTVIDGGMLQRVGLSSSIGAGYSYRELKFRNGLNVRSGGPYVGISIWF